MLLVAAGVLLDGDLILIAQRRGGDLDGRWEFPGGKVEPNETPEHCLVRELQEEFGITAEVGAYLCTSVHTYPTGGVELRVYAARVMAGTFVLQAHRAIQWVTATELDGFDFAPADVPIVRWLQAHAS